MNDLLYCPNCKTLLPDTAQQCDHCQGGVRVPQPEDYVLLASDLEYEINNLCAALSERDIAFREETENVSVLSYRARGFRGNGSVSVRFCDYEQAKEAAKALGFGFPEDESISPAPASKTAAGQAASPAGQKSDKPEADPKQRKLGKVVLYLAILAAMVAAVFLSDGIIGWIRGFFS